jgi:hypothetical protein
MPGEIDTLVALDVLQLNVVDAPVAMLLGFAAKRTI